MARKPRMTVAERSARAAVILKRIKAALRASGRRPRLDVSSGYRLPWRFLITRQWGRRNNFRWEHVRSVRKLYRRLGRYRRRRYTLKERPYLHLYLLHAP